MMRLAFTVTVFEWRGPAPYVFVAVPPDQAEALAEVAPAVTYGWGMVPASVTIGGTTVTTALWPRDGGYVVPIKVALQRAEGVSLGDVVDVELGSTCEVPYRPSPLPSPEPRGASTSMRGQPRGKNLRDTAVQEQ